MRLLDPAPLLSYCAHRLDGQRPTADAVATLCGTSLRQVQRWRTGQRLEAHTADRIACHLQRHPALIWPEWFD